ncbi:MAG: C69 family dipeptidase [Spirochaetales bacterium]|nr:C69 family dipeptidase [Candidatus Physcosoma equi]
MKTSKLARTMFVVLLVAALAMQSVFACTIFLVGKDATTDGSTIASHNDDSSGADYRLWIIPGGEHAEGDMRDLVMDSHNYGDFTNYPEVKDYGNGTIISQIPEAAETYNYLHSRYSFINAKGVAMGESTMSVSRTTDFMKHSYEVMNKVKALGLIDCWNAQDIALERATTARKAVEIMGALIEEFGWYDSGECMNICDGNEAWVFECYGGPLWVAFRLPDNAFFVNANRARIDHVEWDSPDWLYYDGLWDFAVENGLTTGNGTKEEFSPAEAYAPCTSLGCTLREWRALSLVNSSLDLDPSNLERYPLYTIPDHKLSVQDILDLASDYYQGTPYDVSKQPEAGPYGDPLSPQNVYRTINLSRTCYVMIANIKGWLPDEAKCLVWYGYGAADSTYLTPLWPSMKELPEMYRIGTRYEKFQRESAWWTNVYVTEVARINYQSAIQDIKGFRQPILDELYETVDEVQAVASRLILEGKKDAAINLLNSFGNTTAIKWHEDWLELGDTLMGRYMFGNKNMKSVAYNANYKKMINAARDTYND